MRETIPEGWLARLKLTEVMEGHYYRSGDLVQIVCAIDRKDDNLYTAYVLRTKQVIHHFLTDDQVEKLHPLEQLAIVPELREDLPARPE